MSEGVMDDESGESMEPMEEVPLKELGETYRLRIQNLGGGRSYECCL